VIEVDRMMKMLGNVVYTLNQIEVHGEANLNKLLGCIQSVAEVREMLAKAMPEVSADGHGN
jgi:hypothetical protein